MSSRDFFFYRSRSIFFLVEKMGDFLFFVREIGNRSKSLESSSWWNLNGQNQRSINLKTPSGDRNESLVVCIILPFPFFFYGFYACRPLQSTLNTYNFGWSATTDKFHLASNNSHETKPVPCPAPCLLSFIFPPLVVGSSAPVRYTCDTYYDTGSSFLLISLVPLVQFPFTEWKINLIIPSQWLLIFNRDGYGRVTRCGQIRTFDIGRFVPLSFAKTRSEPPSFAKYTINCTNYGTVRNITLRKFFLPSRYCMMLCQRKFASFEIWKPDDFIRYPGRIDDTIIRIATAIYLYIYW